MDAGLFKVIAYLAGLFAVLAFLYWIYKLGKTVGVQEGVQSEAESVAKAEAKLAERLNSDDPNNGIGVQQPDAWKSSTTSTGVPIRVQSGDTDANIRVASER